MSWDFVPNTLEKLNVLLEKHAFASGFLVALIFVGFMRKYFFRSSENDLRELMHEYKKQCADLRKALQQEQNRVRICHEKLEEKEVKK